MSPPSTEGSLASASCTTSLSWNPSPGNPLSESETEGAQDYDDIFGSTDRVFESPIPCSPTHTRFKRVVTVPIVWVNSSGFLGTPVSDCVRVILLPTTTKSRTLRSDKEGVLLLDRVYLETYLICSTVGLSPTTLVLGLDNGHRQSMSRLTVFHFWTTMILWKSDTEQIQRWCRFVWTPAPEKSQYSWFLFFSRNICHYFWFNFNHNKQHHVRRQTVSVWWKTLWTTTTR